MKLFLFLFLCLACRGLSMIQVASFVDPSTPDRGLLHSLFLYHNLTRILTPVDSQHEQVQLVFIDAPKTHQIADKLCQQIETSARQGSLVVAVLGASDGVRSLVVESACRELDMPFLALGDAPDSRSQLWRARSGSKLPQCAIELWPLRTDVGHVLARVLSLQKPANMLVLYSNPEDLTVLQSLMKNSHLPAFERKVLYRTFKKDNRPLIKEALLKLGVNTFVLHLNDSQTSVFMGQVNELDGCKADNMFILTAIDAVLRSPEQLQVGTCNTTVISWTDLDSPSINNLRQHLEEIEYQFADQIGVETKLAIWSDTVAVLASAVERSRILDTGKMQIQNHPKCQRLPLFVKDFRGHLTRSTLFDASTGNVSFHEDGRRKDYQLYVYQSAAGSPHVKTMKWTSVDDQLQELVPKHDGVDANSSRLHLRVTVYLEEPFVMIRADADSLNLTGNDRYEGYCIDLLASISQLQGFTFEIHEVRDRTYGVRESSGKWTGLVGELQSGAADLAVASLTVTYTRSEVLDFTVPFMHLGISILFKRPEESTPGLFRFMAPLSYEVWLYALAAYVGASVSIWTLARMSPLECAKEEQSRLTLPNSFWFTVASLMQQGPEISPVSASTRIATVFWWFFALIFISSYTANLAAFLTTERMITPIENADDLAKQTKIKYGTLGRGSTMTFFNESRLETYEKMWKLMESQPSLFVKSSKEGIQRVKKGDYAYLMESSMLEYAIERDCELMQIGGLLDQKGYAIGLPKGSPHRELISAAILEMQEKTLLTELKDKWWKKQRGGGVCQQTKFTPSEYGAKSVGGIFIVLICGLIASITVAAVELVMAAKKIANAKSIPLSVELQKMIFKSWNEQRGKDDRIKRTIDELIEYKNGLPLPQYSNPSAK